MDILLIMSAQMPMGVNTFAHYTTEPAVINKSRESISPLVGQAIMTVARDRIKVRPHTQNHFPFLLTHTHSRQTRV